MSDTALEAVLRRDRAVVIVALAIITALAWADLAWLAGDMAMGGMDMTGYRMIPAGRGLMIPTVAPWQPIEFGYVFAMWVVMMIGMMMPSAAPMILIYARVGRQASTQGKPFASSSWFAGGYLLAWTAFSLAGNLGAVGARARGAPHADDGKRQQQCSVQRVDPGRPLPVGAAQGSLPIPLSLATAFYSAAWWLPPRTAGALALGFRHGIYCIGCCWALMALLFVGGVMNLFWIAVLAILVLLEKIAPFGRQVARIAGLCLIVSGAWLLALAL